VSRYTRTNSFPAGQKARGSAVQSEFDAVQQWSADMPDSTRVSSGNVNRADAAGTANDIEITLPQPWISYEDKEGFRVSIKIAQNNTGPVTLSVDGIGPKPCVRTDGQPLQASDLLAGSYYDFIYNEALERFQVEAANSIVVAAQAAASAAAGSASAASGSASFASGSESAASASASAASGSANLAEQWSSNPEDNPVAGSKYSAYHWARKAEAAAQQAIGGAQPLLVSGVNIKTFNGESILGGGDIAIEVPDQSESAIAFSLIFGS
jgi:hypothetical protein